MSTEHLAGELTWDKLRKHLDSEISRLRELNDDVALDATKTAALRGRIQALKDLRDLPTTEAHRQAIGQLQLPGGED